MTWNKIEDNLHTAVEYQGSVCVLRINNCTTSLEMLTLNGWKALHGEFGYSEGWVERIKNYASYLFEGDLLPCGEASKQEK